MDLESWHDFFVAAAGAAAALVGLMVVAISVNIERILQYKPLPARAAAAVGSFVMALVASLSGLVTQPTLAFGVELIAFGCVLWLLQFHAIRTGWQSDRMQRRPVYEG